jgi:predicted alpha/beta hydrolase family esterase
MSRPLLLLPGWQNSGPGHWQSLWESEMPDAVRAEMPNWDLPHRASWVEALEEDLSRLHRATREPVVVAAHSVGCMALVHWAAEGLVPIAGALLVAPADVERPTCPEVLRDFAPVPMHTLPFPSRVVASLDDPYLDPERAKAFAEAWGSSFTLLPTGGHFNVASGHGPWPRGEALLQEWLQ